jgi:hypothetical protein
MTKTIKIINGPSKYDLFYSLSTGWTIDVNTEEGVFKVIVEAVMLRDKSNLNSWGFSARTEDGSPSFGAVDVNQNVLGCGTGFLQISTVKNVLEV